MEAARTTFESLSSEQLIGSSLPRIPFDTTEVRWFAAGPMPRRLVNWFTSAGRWGSLEVRDDSYLVGAAPSVGRKRRNRGTFEIKTCLARGPVVCLDSRLSGRTEQWRKVIGTPPGPGATAHKWTDVHKVILTRTYHFSAPDRVVEVTPGNLTMPGCDIELAAVSVAGVEVWTFALEAWGGPDQRLGLLEKSAAAFVAAVGLPESVITPLGVDMSYPAWLNRTVPQDPTSSTTQMAGTPMAGTQMAGRDVPRHPDHAPGSA